MQIKQKRSLTYIVQESDTILSICSKFKIDSFSLKQLNQISQIKSGDILIIPKAFEHYYIVKPLDTYEKIAKQLNVSVEKIKQVTANKKMFIGQKIMF